MRKKQKKCIKCDKIFTRPNSLKRHLELCCKSNIEDQEDILEEILEEQQEEIKDTKEGIYNYILLSFLGGSIFTLHITYKWNCYWDKKRH